MPRNNNSKKTKKLSGGGDKMPKSLEGIMKRAEGQTAEYMQNNRAQAASGGNKAQMLQYILRRAEELRQGSR
jgi:hypothetical protein